MREPAPPGPTRDWDSSPDGGGFLVAMRSDATRREGEQTDAGNRAYNCHPAQFGCHAAPRMIHAENEPSAEQAQTRLPERIEPVSTSEEAARRWVSEHGDILWRFALARTRSADIAEEIVQETVLGAMQGFTSFAQASSERTWLLGIAAHKIADHFRRVQRGKPHSIAATDDEATCNCAVCLAMYNQAGGWANAGTAWPENRTSPGEKAEQIEQLRRCIEALPPGQGEAVWMRDVLGVPADECCKAMGLTATNLWTRMHRARVALRSCMEKKLSAGKEKPS